MSQFSLAISVPRESSSRLFILVVGLFAATSLCVAILWAWWPVVLGVPVALVLLAVAIHGRSSSMVAAFVFVATLLTCFTVSVWAHTPLALYTSLVRYALTLLMGLWGVFVLLGSRGTRLTLFDFGWLALIGCVLLSVLYSIARSVSVGRGLPLAAFCLCLLVTSEVLEQDACCPVRVINALLAAAAVFLAAGLVLVFIQPDIVWVGQRYCGAFGSPSALAGFSCIVLPVALWGMRFHARRVARLLCGLTATLLFGSLILSQARNAIGAFLMGIVAIHLYRRKRSLIAISPPLLLIIALGASQVYRYAGSLTRTAFFDEYINRKQTLETASGRFILWAEALQLIEDRPFMGYGYGTAPLALWSANLPRYLRSESRDLASYGRVLPFLRLNVVEGLNVHNSFLGALLELGLPGTLAFCVIMGAVFRRMALLAPDELPSVNGNLAPYLAGALTAGLVNGLFESGLLYPGGSSFVSFWVIAAVAHSLTEHQSDKAAAEFRGGHHRPTWSPVGEPRSSPACERSGSPPSRGGAFQPRPLAWVK